jgi:F-type H+-transporting ATPase subunit epsilon
MADTFHLEIVTPEKMLVKDDAEEMQIPGKSGYLGILPGHAPLITELGVGEMTYRKGGETHRFVVAWGFAEVLPDRVTILAENADRPQEIDVKKAQAGKQRAEEHMSKGQSEEDFTRAEAEMRLADTQLEVAGKKN